MTSTARVALSETTSYDWDGFRAAIGDVPVTTEPVLVKRKSRDYFWYSPILKDILSDKFGDLVALPRDEADVIRIAAACAKYRIPLTVRGAGTGNYGQAVPLEGGVVLDMTALEAIEWLRPGLVRVQAGRKMVAIDDETRPQGWELRMHPSTKRMATIGGFVAGGSGGVGSISYGGLREPGNIVAARVVTLEQEPRVLELRGEEPQKVNRTYGTTGIITALEMPMAPAWDWIEFIVAFDDFAEALRFGHAAALVDGIVKKLLTPIAAPIASHFTGLRGHIPEGRHILIGMVAEPSMASLRALLKRFQGAITYEGAFDESPSRTPLYEYTWNHTTLQLLKTDRGVTYLQSLFPAERLIEAVAEMEAIFGDEVLPHLEFIRFAGKVTASALQIVRYTSPERLNEIIEIHEAHGITIANPHVYTVEDGSRHKRTDADQLGFKHEVDPHGLLNPGKMRSFVARDA